MCLQIEIAFSVPEETARIAKAAFPKGNPYIQMRDLLGTLFEDPQFTKLFPVQGQPAETPWRLALTSVFQFAEGLTDRQAAEAVRSRIDWKYAQGLELTDPGFDYSLLCEFRQRLVNGGAEKQLLDTMLTLFVEKGLLKAGGRQRTDSTHVLAAVRSLNRLEKVGETLRHTLNALAAIVPEWLQTIAPSHWYERYGSRVESYHFPKSKTGQEALALTLGSDGFLLLDAIDQATQMAFLKEVPAVIVLRQVWKDQFLPPPQPPRFREIKDMPASAQQIASPYDPEARYATKRDISWVGYKVHLTETCDPETPNLITDVLTTVATSPDEDKLPVIQKCLQERDLLPSEHLVDAGYANAKVLVASQTSGVTVTAPVSLDTSWQARAQAGFERSAFRVDWEAQVVTCPAGKPSQSFLPYSDPTKSCSFSVRFAKKDCLACANHAQCTRSKSETRLLLLPSQQEYEALQAARAREQTEEFKLAYAGRAGIEGTHSQALRRCGLRRCRYIGLAKTALQHVLTACALNLVRAVEWLTVAHPQKRGPSRFATLRPLAT